MSHHIHNILLFRVKFGLEVERLSFHNMPFSLMLLHVIHFSSPVQKGLDFVPSKQRCAYDNSIVQIFSTWFTWHPSWILPHQSYLPNMVRNGSLSWIKPFCDVVGKGSCSNIALTTSSSIKDGRGLSERSKSPVSNFSYHLLHVLSETVPSPNTFDKFLHAS